MTHAGFSTGPYAHCSHSRRKFSQCKSFFRPQVELLEARCLLSGTPVETLDYHPSRIIVRFEPDAPISSGAEILPGTELGWSSTLVPGLRVIHLAEGITVDAALAAFRASPLVIYAQPDPVIHLAGMNIPNDPFFPDQLNMHNTGQVVYPSGPSPTGSMLGEMFNLRGKPDADIDAPEAWAVTTGSGRMLVAVLDGGIDKGHPDLAANIWTNPGEIPGNGIDDDSNGYVDDIHGYNFAETGVVTGEPHDTYGHGTLVAGVLGAVGNNGEGVAGVIWNVQLMPVKIASYHIGFTTDVLAGAEYAVNNGAKVVNNSYYIDDPAAGPPMCDIIKAARDHGVIFVTGAGNDGGNIDDPANDAPGLVTDYFPAECDSDNVVTVAATNHQDELASFSNYGPNSVDLAAPGDHIVTTASPATVIGDPTGYNRTRPSFGLDSEFGTSFSSPHVAGALALVWDLHPDWNYKQVIDQVLKTVDPLPSLEGKVTTGGRLNVGTAVNAVSLTIGDVTQAEGNKGSDKFSDFTFTVSLNQPSSEPVTVQYATADGTATTSDKDYQSTSGALTFQPGQTQQTLTVRVRGDSRIEDDETFFVRLSNPTGAFITHAEGLGTIVNDDQYGLTQVGFVPLAATNGDLYVFNGFAYIGTSHDNPGLGIKIVDVRDPENPLHINTLAPSHSDSSAQDMSVIHIDAPDFQGDVLVVGLQQADNGDDEFALGTGIDVWDVSDPHTPVFLSYLDTNAGLLGATGVHELSLFYRADLGRAFAGLSVWAAENFVDGDDGRTTGEYQLVDITDPYHPVRVSDWGARRDLGLLPPAGVFPGNCPTLDVDHCVSNHSNSVSADGQRAYLSYWDAGVIILDITDPARPTFLGRGEVEDDSGGDNIHSAVEAAGGNVLVTTSETVDTPDGYPQLWSIEDPANPVVIGSFRLHEHSDTVHNPIVIGDLLFLSWYSEGVRVLDISDPANPFEVGAWEFPPEANIPEGELQGAWGIAVEGDYVYISDTLNGLRILKLPRPGQSNQAASQAAPAPASSDLARSSAAVLLFALPGDGHPHHEPLLQSPSSAATSAGPPPQAVAMGPAAADIAAIDDLFAALENFLDEEESAEEDGLLIDALLSDPVARVAWPGL